MGWMVCYDEMGWMVCDDEMGWMVCYNEMGYEKVGSWWMGIWEDWHYEGMTVIQFFTFEE
jgi:hypothetical protein